MTKNGTPHTIPLPDEIVGRLKALPQGGPYVFSCKRGEVPWPIETATAYWRRIRIRAGLADVTIHDLRRTWASWAAMDGENLSIIAAVLNHSNLEQTQIYARLNAAPLYKAMEKQAKAIMAMEGTAEQATARAAHPLKILSRLLSPLSDQWLSIGVPCRLRPRSGPNILLSRMRWNGPGRSSLPSIAVSVYGWCKLFP